MANGVPVHAATFAPAGSGSRHLWADGLEGFVRALAFLCFGLVSACATETATERFELTGRVTEGTTDEGIPRATVTFVSDTLFRASAETSGDGTYQMAVETDVPFGQARAEKDGYLSDERTVFFDTPTRRIDLQLRPAPDDSM
jgi:hypothetical protein